MDKVLLRLAKQEDASQLWNIYVPYVKKTAITFEYDPPTLEEFKKRIEHTLQRYPYIVAERQGKLLGYTYVSPFKSPAAYDHTVETTIYLAPEARGSGIGKLLYQALEKILIKQNVIVLEACIAASPRKDDPNLTDASIRFHEKMGYQKVAYFASCGYKFERWYDVLWMEKLLCPHPQNPPLFIPFSCLSENDKNINQVQ